MAKLFKTLTDEIVSELKRCLYEKRLLKNDGEIILYHYTKLETFVKDIIKHNEEKNVNEVSLALSSAKYMNDPYEIKYGEDVLKELYKELNCTREARKNIEQNKIFTISFSCNGDSLPMWSLYGKDGHGVSLGFSYEKLDENEETGSNKNGNSLMNIFPCLYDRSKIREVLSHMLQYVNNNHKEEIAEAQYIIDSFLKCMIKHSAYEYEKEYRIIQVADDYENYSFYTVSRNCVIPRYLLNFNNSFLKEIIVGPNIVSEKTKESLQEFLENKKMSHVKVDVSQVPYQS